MSLVPKVPGAFEAELRPYQEEGFQWMARLAEAGFGACLADDMGLGKTIQALALLLQRGRGGPALVVAPTSVCANWASEILKFAPSLRVRPFAEGGPGTDSEFPGVHGCDALQLRSPAHGIRAPEGRGMVHGDPG